MKTVVERYQTDAEFRALVELLASQIYAARVVAAFAREHLSHNDGGAGALRVYHTLAEAVETDAPALAILAPTNQPINKPQRTDL